MKYIVLILCIACIKINLSANTNWIPLEPVNEKLKTNPQMLKPINKFIDNAKVIKKLLDKKNDKQELEISDIKKWYILDNIIK